MTHRIRRRFLSDVVVVAALMCTYASQAAPATSPPEDPAVAEFNARVKEYMALHDKLEARLPKLPKKATPQEHDIAYFVVGGGGQLAVGDIGKDSVLTAKGFDTDQAFLAVEISGDTMYFNAISRVGEIVDSGTIKHRVPAKP